MLILLLNVWVMYGMTTTDELALAHTPWDKANSLHKHKWYTKKCLANVWIIILIRVRNQNPKRIYCFSLLPGLHAFAILLSKMCTFSSDQSWRILAKMYTSALGSSSLKKSPVQTLQRKNIHYFLHVAWQKTNSWSKWHVLLNVNVIVHLQNTLPMMITVF